MSAVLDGGTIQALTLRAAARSMPQRLAAAEAALTAPRDALAQPNFKQVAKDILECGPSDAVLDAQEIYDEAEATRQTIWGLTPRKAAVIFGSREAWNAANARLQADSLRLRAELDELKAAAGMSVATVKINTDEIARPIGAQSRVQWTGD